MATSWASNAGIALSMRSNRRRDTAPEIAVRRELFARGFRYRIDLALTRNRRKKVDIVFPRARLAVFVDGCFWHGCPLHATHPRANADYWGPKLARNKERDRETDVELFEEGWSVCRYWEHQPVQEVVDDIERRLAGLKTER